MAESQKRFQFLAVLVGVVVLLGGGNFLYLVKKPQVIAREPASLSSPIVVVNTEAHSEPQATQELKGGYVQVDCSLEPLELRLRGHQIRLKSGPCRGGLRLHKVNNKTNGVTSSLFDLQAEGVTTDYIALESGENHLELFYQEKNQKLKLRRLSVLVE